MYGVILFLSLLKHGLRFSVLKLWKALPPGDDIRRGFRRGRLSLAVSENSGQSWKHFKTLELSEGLDPEAGRIEPDGQLKSVVRASKDCGEMPDRWSFFHYPNADFAAGHVFISYLRGRLVEDASSLRKVGQPQEEVLRVFPVSWLYEDK